MRARRSLRCGRLDAARHGLIRRRARDRDARSPSDCVPRCQRPTPTGPSRAACSIERGRRAASRLPVDRLGLGQRRARRARAARTSPRRRYWRTTCERDPIRPWTAMRTAWASSRKRVAREQAVGRVARADAGRRRRAGARRRSRGRPRTGRPAARARRRSNRGRGPRAGRRGRARSPPRRRTGRRRGRPRSAVTSRSMRRRSGCRPYRCRCRAARPGANPAAARPWRTSQSAWRSEPAEVPSASGHRSAAIASRDRGRRARTSRREECLGVATRQPDVASGGGPHVEAAEQVDLEADARSRRWSASCSVHATRRPARPPMGRTRESRPAVPRPRPCTPQSADAGSTRVPRR